jgi:hypothetical protein
MAEQSPDPISRELRDAFGQAIGQYGEWRRGESEPEVSLNLKFVAISTVCALVDKFEDPLPESHWNYLGLVTPGGEDLPIDPSYQRVAPFLARLIRERKAQFDRPDPG